MLGKYKYIFLIIAVFKLWSIYICMLKRVSTFSVWQLILPSLLFLWRRLSGGGFCFLPAIDPLLSMPGTFFSILTVCADHFELTAARFASLFANCIGKRLESICIGGGSLEERRIGRHSLNHAFIHSVAHSIIHPPTPAPSRAAIQIL